MHKNKIEKEKRTKGKIPQIMLFAWATETEWRMIGKIMSVWTETERRKKTGGG